MLGCMAIFFGLGACGAWLLWSGWNQFNDHTAKLSIGPYAFTDHRINLVIPWRLVYDVRVQVTTTNGKLSDATMYLKTSLRGDVGEIPINLFGLDRPYRDIVELVRQRAATA